MVKLDIDEYMEISEKFYVISIPTLILFINGDTVVRFVDERSKEKSIKYLIVNCVKRKKEQYRYAFDKKGTRIFHGHINPIAGGTVTIK